MHPDDVEEFELPSEYLTDILQSIRKVGGKVRIQIPKKYRRIETQNQCRLQVYEDEVTLDGELLLLSPLRRQFLLCFANENCVKEETIASKLYGDQTAVHRKIKKLADDIEKELGERITLDFDHGYWTIHFNQL